MIGSEVERGGIIRHGAKMITAVAEATVPQFSRGRAQGLRRRALRDGRARASARTPRLALPTARIAVMGPEAAVNAVYANKIAEIADADGARARSSQDRRREYEQDVDLVRLAADLVIDGIVEPDELRAELLRRLRYAVAPGPRVQRAPPRCPAGLGPRARRSTPAAPRGGVVRQRRRAVSGATSRPEPLCCRHIRDSG